MDLQNFIESVSEPNEMWKDFPEFENFYMISSFGRILAKEKLVYNGHKDVLKPHKLLKVSTSDNRLSIQVSDGEKKRKFSIPLLVAKIFLPQPHPDYLLKFKDNNPLNSKIDNLIWVPKIDRHAKCIIDPLKGEEWRDIPGYEGFYQISNKGRIMSLGREIQATNRVITTQNRLMVLSTDLNNYQYVTLCKNTNQKRFFVHRLVAQVFIPNPENYPHIDHIDTNKINNCVENLRWVTPIMNMENPLTKEHLSKVRKNAHLNESWNCSPIVQLNGFELIKVYPSIAEASRNGFGYSSIQKCLSGRQRKHKNFQWMYLSDYVKLSPESVIAKPAVSV